MRLVRHACWAAAVAGLLGAATVAFAPPPAARPAPAPPMRPPTFTPGPARPRAPTAPGFSIRPQTTTGLRTQLSGMVVKQPAGALPKLAGLEARTLLPEATRVTLGKQAVHQLAVQVEAGGNAARLLPGIHGARQSGRQLPAEVRSRLDRLAQVAERRALAEGLRDVQASAGRGDWRDAGKRATRRIAELRETTITNLALRGEALEALGRVHEVAVRLEALERAEAAMKAIDPGKPAETAARLERLDRAGLPKAVEARTEALRGLQELRQFAAPKWSRAGDAGRVRDAVARLERDLADLPGADARLGKLLQQEIAVRAALEGHAEGYFRLMPDGGPAEHAANLLRDLKALALGEGAVSTPAAKSALGEPGGPASPRAPPGVDPLIPEGAKSSWRPPVREPAGADLPALQQEAANGLKAQAESQLQLERAALGTKAEAARANLSGVYQRVIAPEAGERRRLAEIEAALARPLAAEERVRARDWHDENRPVRLVVSELKKQAEEEDDAFVARVEALLKRPLSGEEKVVAKRLRRAGHTPAQAANHLRS